MYLKYCDILITVKEQVELQLNEAPDLKSDEERGESKNSADASSGRILDSPWSNPQYHRAVQRKDIFLCAEL